MPAFLSYDFMQRALAAGAILSLVAPTIGIFFVVRRYSSMADTLAHVSLAGVAAGLLLGIQSALAALIACVLAVLGIERVREQGTLASDTIVSLFLFGGLATGVILLGLNPSSAVNVSSYLFGSILTVTAKSVVQVAVIGMLALILAATFWRPFFAISLDEETARAAGLPVRGLNRVLLILGAATIAIAINIVGVLLIGALMVIPVLGAMQFKLGFRDTWAVAVGISFLSVVAGLTGSFYLNLASGATIVLCTIACFLASTLWSRLHKA